MKTSPEGLGDVPEKRIYGPVPGEDPELEPDYEPKVPDPSKRRLLIRFGAFATVGVLTPLLIACSRASEPMAIVEPASAAQRPSAPELTIPFQPAAPESEKEKASEEFQVDMPSTEIPQEWQSLIGEEKEEEVKEPIIYTVEEGDTLTKISQEHNNLPVEIIYNMNKPVIGEDPNLLKPGQELLIIHWGPVEASQDFAYKKAQEILEKGEQITWIYFTLGKEASVQEVADFFGIDTQELAELNGIEDLTTPLVKNYYLMIPAGEGFVFTERDREAGRRWVPIPGFFLDAIWWENPSGEATAGPWYPNEAFILEPYQKEYWIESSWSTADNPDPEFFVPEIITDTPANRTIEITDENGNVRYEEREGFLVYGKQKVLHTEYRKVKAGEWTVPETPA